MGVIFNGLGPRKEEVSVVLFSPGCSARTQACLVGTQKHTWLLAGARKTERVRYVDR